MLTENRAPQPSPRSPEVAAYIRQVEALGLAAMDEVKTESGVAYGPEPRHRLDIHLPSDRKLAGAPTLFFVHGGRWRMGFREWNAFQAPVLAEMGVILVSPQYALSPDFRFPTQLEDILTALSWVHANISAFGGAPDRLYVAGHSAGGHLSALATVRTDLHGAFGLPTVAIRACLPISGTMNLDFDEVLAGSEEEEIRQILLADDADAPLASPLRHAQHAATPFFISYGERDFGRVISTSQEMHRALEAAGNQASAYMFPGFGHFETHIDLARPGSAWNQRLKTMIGT